MGREIFFLHFGQAGAQLGSAIWELICLEHAVDANGQRCQGDTLKDLDCGEHIDTVFCEGTKSWSPRAIMVDLEPTVIDEIRCGVYRQLWRPGSLITGKEDAANNYGRGHYTVGRLALDRTMESVRRVVEDANNLAAFTITRSNSGGTGSGLSSLIIDQLSEEYGKKYRFSASVFPSSMFSQSTVDPYNNILTTNSTMETLDCDILFDNQTLYERFTKNMGIQNPSFTGINRLLAKMLSSIFMAHRFVYNGTQHADTTELLTNLIPYPRIHFPALSYAPIESRVQLESSVFSVRDLTKAVFSRDAQTLDFPCNENAYISCAMLYRGLDSPRSVYEALQYIKSGSLKSGASFVDWCPTGFKLGLNSVPPMPFDDSPIGLTEKDVCMLAGNLGLHEAWHRNNMKFDLLYARKSFLHWFVGEGVEEGEFLEARENIAQLEQDYLDLASDLGKAPEKTEEQENENNFLIQPGFNRGYPRESIRLKTGDIATGHQKPVNKSSSIVIGPTSSGARGDQLSNTVNLRRLHGLRESGPAISEVQRENAHMNPRHTAATRHRMRHDKTDDTAANRIKQVGDEAQVNISEDVKWHSEASNYTLSSATTNPKRVNDKNMNNPRMWDSNSQDQFPSSISDITRFSVNESSKIGMTDSPSLDLQAADSLSISKAQYKHRHRHGHRKYSDNISTPSMVSQMTNKLFSPNLLEQPSSAWSTNDITVAESTVTELSVSPNRRQALPVKFSASKHTGRVLNHAELVNEPSPNTSYHSKHDHGLSSSKGSKSGSVHKHRSHRHKHSRHHKGHNQTSESTNHGYRSIDETDAFSREHKIATPVISVAIENN